MSEWKADYIRMWQIYHNKQMSIQQVDSVINEHNYTPIILRSYKLGKLLEAVGRLKFPEN